MKNYAKASKSTTLAGVIGLTAAGIVATIVLANDTAADTSDLRVVKSSSSRLPSTTTTTWVLGPRTPSKDGFKWKTSYLGPKTADAAEVWIESGAEYLGPRTADAAEHWIGALRDD